MTDVAEFLMKHYYSHYNGREPNIVPTIEQLEGGIDVAEKAGIIEVVREGNKITACALFVTLTDETYKNIDKLNIRDVEVIKAMLPERGHNVHFLLLASLNPKEIVPGYKRIAKRLGAKTVSWYSPDFSRVHKKRMV